MNRAEMTRARDDADELLGVALDLQESAANAETASEVAREHRIADSYIRLAGAAIDRFEEAALGS